MMRCGICGTPTDMVQSCVSCGVPMCEICIAEGDGYCPDCSEQIRFASYADYHEEDLKREFYYGGKVA